MSNGLQIYCSCLTTVLLRPKKSHNVYNCLSIPMLASVGQGNDGRGNMYMITKRAEKSLSVYWRSLSAKSAKENKSIHPPCGQFGVLKQSVDTVDARILVQTYSIYWHWINYIRVSLQFFVQLYCSCYLLFESHPNKANIWQTFIVYPAFFFV